MSDFANSFLVQLASASGYLTASALVAAALLWSFKYRSPSVHAATWFLVLVQGLVLTQVPVPIPVASNSPAQHRNAHEITTDATSGNASEWKTSKGFASNPTAETPAASPPLNQQDATQFSWVVKDGGVWLLGLWAAGMLFFMLRWMYDYLRYTNEVDRWDACDLDEWNAEWLEVLRKHGDGQTLPLHVSHRLGPMLSLGPKGYRIVVPYSLWIRLTREERQTILRHELAHYQRGDVLKSFLVHTMALVQWFNPLAWFAVRRFEDSLERACDDIVKESDSGWSTHYAKALLATVEFSSPPSPLARATKGGVLAGRIRRVIASQSSHDSRFKKALLLFVVVALVLAHAIRIETVALDNSTSNNRVPADPAAGQGIDDGGDVKEGVDEAAKADQAKVDKPNAATKKSKKEIAIRRLRSLGGHVRLFHPANHRDHWVQIILETRLPNRAPTKGRPVKPKGPFDDFSMVLVRTIAMTAPTNLHLRNTAVTHKGIARLGGTKVRRLAMSGKSTDDQSLKQLPTLRHLTRLSISETSITDKGLRHLGECKSLQALAISGGNVTRTGLSHVAKLSKLRKLTLGQGFGNEALEFVNALRQLESLTVSKSVTSDFFRGLRQLPALKKLTVSGANVNDACLQYLSQKATRLDQLYIRNAQVTNEGLRFVPAFKGVTVLCLAGCPISDDGMQHVKRMQNLRWLDLGYTKITNKGLRLIGQMKGLRQLFLGSTKISPQGLNHLKGLTDLRYLAIHGNDITEIPEWMKKRRMLYVNK